jgi:hypothetical protein
MRKAILFVLFVIALAACRPISRGPNPYTPASPLARAFVSPVYGRGQAPAIEQIRMLIAPLDELRAGTIPAPLVRVTPRAYLPLTMSAQDYPCDAEPMAAQVIDLIINHPGQQRLGPHCSNEVTRIAQMLADDMAAREYYSHTTPEGWGPNHWLLLIGCLPPGYPENGNTTQSIALNYFDAERVVAAWLASKSHRAHLLGLHPTYQAQDALGAGVRITKWATVWVFMSTEQCN